MLHNLFSLTALFRLINFIAFISFFAFIFKRRVLPSIYQKIQEKKLLLQNLEQQKQGIKYQQSNIDNAIEQQKHLADELTKKIDIWRAKVAEKQEKEYSNEKKLLQKVQEKYLKQSHEQMLANLNKNSIPNVLVDVQKNLEQEFAQEHQGQLFIKDIVNFIQERNA